MGVGGECDESVCVCVRCVRTSRSVVKGQCMHNAFTLKTTVEVSVAINTISALFDGHESAHNVCKVRS
eukprot:m.111215 g.111215  ORF g.111215 m.111215 type:complete len:68 (-) comp28105_c0_seq1:185-388(-)